MINENSTKAEVLEAVKQDKDALRYINSELQKELTQ